MKIIKNKGCRMCGGMKFKNVLNMGKNPLVNSLLDSKDASPDPVFPLVVKQCQNCFLVQLKDIVDSQEIYKEVDYLYFSGDMPKLDEYFKPYADKVADLAQGGLVMEIGSNDGLMLKMIQEKGNKVLGVDPASNVVARALKNGVPTISDFFSERLAKTIRREYGSAKIIYGNNCIAHLNNLDDLMKGVSLLLEDGGVFVVECNYWGGMVKNKNYALVYHDHFSYFTLKNWADFAPRYGLYAFDAEVTPAQGGSLRVFMKKAPLAVGESTQSYTDLFIAETESQLNSYEVARQYGRECKEEAKKLNKLVSDIKVQGKKIAGYGAAAKGFSVLKLADIDQRHIDYFVDDSPAKQGKYTPVNRIPVISRAEAENNLPDYFFITAPNYEKIIIEKESQFVANGGKFITVDSRIV